MSNGPENPAKLPDLQPYEHHTFVLDGGLSAELWVFPKRGDTVEKAEDGWTFRYPTLGTEETIFKPFRRHAVEKGEKRIMTQAEIKAEVQRRKEQAAREKARTASDE